LQTTRALEAVRESAQRGFWLPVWNDLAGFSFVKEYDDIKNAGGDLQGLMGDDRLVSSQRED